MGERGVYIKASIDKGGHLVVQAIRVSPMSQQQLDDVLVAIFCVSLVMEWNGMG